MKFVTFVMIAAMVAVAGCTNKSKAPEIVRGKVVARPAQPVTPDTPPAPAPEPAPAPAQDPVGKSLDILSSGYSSPVILNEDTVVIGGGNNVYFLSLKGEQKAVYQTNGRIFARPLVTADGKAVVGSFDGGIYVFNADGSLFAKYMAEGAIFNSLVEFADGTLLAAALDGYFYFITPSGELKAKVSANGQFVTGLAMNRKENFATFVTMEGHLWALSSGGLVLYDKQVEVGALSTPVIQANGSLLYGGDGNKLVSVGYEGSILSTSVATVTGDIIDTPVILGNGTIAATEANGKIWFFAPPGLFAVSYQAEGDNNLSAPVELNDGLVAVTGKKAVYILDPKDASLVEKVDVPVQGNYTPASSQPAIAADGTIVFAASNGPNLRVYFVKRGQTLE